MTKQLPLPQMQQKLEELFIFISDFALRKSNFAMEVRIAAAQASAQIAGVLLGIRELNLLGMLPGPDPDDFDHSPSGEEDPGLDGDGLDLDEGFDSEPE